ncbi:MAG: bifunctional hydroxymethylpyrimidine kinase/phosphomethylpyrimidine kinase [Lysobacterales bacterium]
MTLPAKPHAFALTIAGSDSGGGAGIQADLRSFASQGVYGLSAITAVTAQNSLAVSAVQVLSTRLIRAQIQAVATDFPVAAVKTGMLASRAIVRLVAAAARGALANRPWVVDPVMIATSGATLLRADAERSVREDLLPLATVLTPNVPEAEVLLGRKLSRQSQLERAAADLRELGAHTVLLKGGHVPGREVIDVYADAGGISLYRAPRRRLNGHGTGCCLASLIAARLALGEAPAAAVAAAIAAFRVALEHGAVVGSAPVWVPYPLGPQELRS